MRNLTYEVSPDVFQVLTNPPRTSVDAHRFVAPDDTSYLIFVGYEPKIPGSFQLSPSPNDFVNSGFKRIVTEVEGGFAITYNAYPTTFRRTELNYSIITKAGDDLVQSGTGTLSRGYQADRANVEMGDGDDTALVSAFRSNVFLNRGQDIGLQLSENGSIFGMAGDDSIAGADAHGGAGDDILVGLGDSALWGGKGSDGFAAIRQRGQDSAIVGDFSVDEDYLKSGAIKTMKVVAGTDSDGETVTEVVIVDKTGAKSFQLDVDPAQFAGAKFNVRKDKDDFAPQTLETPSQDSWIREGKAVQKALTHSIHFNFAPEVLPQKLTTTEDQGLVFDPLAGASDPDGDTVSLLSFNLGGGKWHLATPGTTHSIRGHTVELKNNGMMRFEPAPGFDTQGTGALTMSVRVVDDAKGQNVNTTWKNTDGTVDRAPTLDAFGTIEIDVTPEPRAVGKRWDMDENSPVPIPILQDNEHFDLLSISSVEIGHQPRFGAFTRNSSAEGDALRLTPLNKVRLDSDAQGNRFDQLDTGETGRATFIERFTTTDGTIYQAVNAIVVKGENDAPRIVLPKADRQVEVDVTPGRETYLPKADRLKLDVMLEKTALSRTWFDDPEGHRISVRPEGEDRFWTATGLTGFITDMRALNELGEGEVAVLETRSGAPLTVDLVGVDQRGASDGAHTFQLVVQGENDAPIAIDNTYTMRADAGRTFNVLANDLDPDRNDRLSLTEVSVNGMSGNSVSLPDGTKVEIVRNRVEVTPGTDFIPVGAGDTDAFTFRYTVTDAFGASDTADVTVTLRGVNDGPNAQDDPNLGTVDQNGALTVPLDALTRNDTDPDVGQTPDPSWITRIDGQSFDLGTDIGIPRTLFNGGSIVHDDRGIATFAPGSDFDDLMLGEKREAVFTYQINDGALADRATAKVMVTGLNDAPVAQDDQIVVTERSGLQTGSLFASNGNGPDTDVDLNDTLSVSAVVTAGNVGRSMTLPNSNVSVTVQRDGTVLINTQTSIPLAVGESVSDTLPYTLRDSTGLIDDAVFTITVVGDEDVGTVDPPVPGNVNAPLFEDTAIAASLPITDPSGTGIAAALTQPPEPGTGSASIEGTLFQFDPLDDFAGLGPGEAIQFGFGYSATDGTGNTTGGPDDPDGDGAIFLSINGRNGDTTALLTASMLPDIPETLLLPLDTFVTPISVPELLIVGFHLGEDQIAADSYGIQTVADAEAALAGVRENADGHAVLSLSGPIGDSAVDDTDLVFVGIGADDLSAASSIFVV